MFALLNRVLVAGVVSTEVPRVNTVNANATTQADATARSDVRVRTLASTFKAFSTCMLALLQENKMMDSQNTQFYDEARSPLAVLLTKAKHILGNKPDQPGPSTN